MIQERPGPVVVSFAAGAEHYHTAARRLREQCDALGFDHSIEHLHHLHGRTWDQICREKVLFYQRKLLELNRPILWLDADTTLVRRPDVLDAFTGDFAAIVNGTGLTDFDPYVNARTWRPTVLYFGATDTTRRFLAHLVEVERSAPDNVTDDYILEEGWRSSPEQLSVLVIPTHHICRTMDERDERTWFVHGASGNVTDFRGKVIQHSTILNRGKVLTEVAADYLRRREPAAAEAVLIAARDYAWDTAEHAGRLAEALRRQARFDEADRAIEDFASRHPQDNDGRLMSARLSTRRQDYDGAAGLLRSVIDDGAPQAARARSMLSDLERDKRAAALGLADADRPALWWMKQPYPGNLGDILNPYLIEHITGRPPRFAPRGSGMLAAGSVVKFAGDGCDVWGSGTARLDEPLNPRAAYHAVRGPLTRDAVVRSGAQAPLVVGDPALLMPRFYQPRRGEERAPVGIVQHVSQRHRMPAGEGVRFIDTACVAYEEIERFIDELTSCEVIVSSSLHGIVLALAYGIPARWARDSSAPQRIPGDDTKYVDFFRSCSVPEQDPLDLARYGVLDAGLRHHVDTESVNIQIDTDALLHAFPWQPGRSPGS